MMKVKNKRVGDIFLNPCFEDLWILKQVWSDSEQEEIWILDLVNDDYTEELEVVEGFKKVGNIYDMVEEKILIEEERKN